MHVNGESGTAKIIFRAKEVEGRLLQRARPAHGGSVHVVAQRDLARYYALLDSSIAESSLSGEELARVVELLREKVPFDLSRGVNHYRRLLIAGLVAEPVLVTKIAKLSAGAVLAIVDAAERHYAWPNDFPIEALCAEFGISRNGN